MKRMLMVAGLASTLALPTFAATGGVARADGATIINTTRCQSTGGYTYCTTMKVELNTTIAQSGNVSQEINGTETVTLTNATGTVLQSQDYTTHYHVLYKDGQLHEVGDHQRLCLTTIDGSVLITTSVHYANGMLQYSNSDVTPGGC